MMTSSGTLVDGNPTNYGFGWSLSTKDGQRVISHNGGTFGFGSVNEIYPGLIAPDGKVDGYLASPN